LPVTYDVEFNSAAHFPAADVPDLAERAEAAGFGAYWKGESNSTDPLVLLSAIASRTSTIQLGTAIYHIYGRSPVTMGIQSATLQDLSGGRLLLGLGVANHAIAAWHGGTFDRPLRRMREYIEVVKAVARGERVEYEGEIQNTGKAFRLSWKPSYPDLPVLVAGLGEQMTRMIGRIGEGVVLNMATPEKIREISERVRGAAQAAGRNPDDVQIIAKARVSLHPDREVARERLRQVLTFYNIAEFYGDMLVAQGFGDQVEAVRAAFREGGFKQATAQITDEYMDKLPALAATSIDEVKERLQRYADAGATRIIIPYVPAGDDVVEDAKHFLTTWDAAG
jgi:probable F420-dependent oxidoreductase